MFHTTRDADEARHVIGATGASIVVAVPIFNAFDEVRACTEAIWRHAPEDVPLLLVDDASPDEDALARLERAAAMRQPERRTTVLLRRASNGGFVESANLAFGVAGRADVVLVNSDVQVAANWIQGLHAAVTVDNTVASASCLTNHGSILSVPERNQPTSCLPRGLDLARAADLVSRGSPKLHPHIPTAVGHCVYFRRIALDAVGVFSTAFSPGYGEEVEWSQRAVGMGFTHVLADDVFVFHSGGASFGAGSDWASRRERHDALVARRHPYYLQYVKSVSEDATSPLAASLLAARRSLNGLTVLIDGSCLGMSLTGTQRVVLELTGALAADDRVGRIELLVPDVLPGYVRAFLRDIPNVAPVTARTVNLKPSAKADVVFRPYQFTSLAEVQQLERLGHRLVVLQLDFIAYQNPAYFASYGEWVRYRATQRLALTAVDGVGFISQRIYDQAAQAHLLPKSTAWAVVHPGVHGAHLSEPARPPAGVDGLGLARGFLLQLGAAFAHKNRLFTLRLAEQLWMSGWEGTLVLAGAEPASGSSAPYEREWLAHRPEWARKTVILGGVSEAEKNWLYANASLVVYPSISEGFGLVPFEAAEFGTPCLSTRQGSLDEILPDELLTLSTFDPQLEAPLVRRILDSPEVAAGMVEAVRRCSEEFTWRRAGDALAELLLTVTGAPRSPTVAVRFGTESVSLVSKSSYRLGRVLLDPLAESARRSRLIQNRVFPGATVRGKLLRRAYHRIAGDL